MSTKTKFGTLYTSSAYSEGDHYVPTSPTPMTQIYDPVTDSWTQGTAPAAEITGRLYSAVTNGFMAPSKTYFFYNGYHDSNAFPYHTQVYSLNDNSWIAGADLPSRMGFSVTVVNDLIYVVSGCTFSWPSLDQILANPNNRDISFSYKTDVLRYTPFGYGAVRQKSLFLHWMQAVWLLGVRFLSILLLTAQ